MELLEKAFQESAALSESEQNWVAQMLLDTIQDEHEWARQFASSQDMLSSLADQAMADFHAGLTKEIKA